MKKITAPLRVVASWLLLTLPGAIAANVIWVGTAGGGDGTTWTDSRNWSGNAVPTATSDVTIGVFPRNPTIQIARREE